MLPLLKKISPAPRPEEELRLLRQPDSGQLQAGPAPERQESLPLQGDVMEESGELRTVMQPASPPQPLRVRVASFRIKGFQQYLTSGPASFEVTRARLISRLSHARRLK